MYLCDGNAVIRVASIKRISSGFSSEIKWMGM